MPHHDSVTETGEVRSIFAHRFVLKTDHGRLLADLGPEAAERIGLQRGDRVTIEGEQHPSEIKVRVLMRNGERFRAHAGPPHHQHEDLTEEAAREAVSGFGYRIRNVRRGPRHYELLAERDGERTEFHVHADLHPRAMRSVPAGDDKWG